MKDRPDQTPSERPSTPTDNLAQVAAQIAAQDRTRNGADDPAAGAAPDAIGPDAIGPIAIRGADAIRDQCLALAEQARRELLIFSRDLDPLYYDQRPFLDAVQRLALDVPRPSVRVLLVEPRPVVADGHRLIELARRLTSRIEMRRVGEDDRERVDAFLIADNRGYCWRPFADRHEAEAEADAPQRARLLGAEFARMWERATVDTELRRLYL